MLFKVVAAICGVGRLQRRVEKIPDIKKPDSNQLIGLNHDLLLPASTL
jgi:hypothetical protein